MTEGSKPPIRNLEETDRTSNLLSGALDGNASVLRPLIVVILIYVIQLFAVLGFTAMSRDKAVAANENARVEAFLDAHLDEASTTLNAVAPIFAELAITRHESQPYDIPAHLLDALSQRHLASQAFLFSPSGDALAQEAIPSERPGVTDQEIRSRIRSMASISNYTETAVSDIVNIGGEVFLLSTRAIPCSGFTMPCSVASVGHLDETIASQMEDFWQVSSFGVSTIEPTGKSTEFAPIQNLSNETIGWFHWKSRHQGPTVLNTIMPWLSLLTTGVLIMCWLVWRRGLKISAQVLQSQQEAKHSALHDPLTGLANRTLMNARLEEALNQLGRQDKGFALHIIDLDRFKNVNDTLGHQAVDELIQEAAARLTSVCRNGDTVARLGGDEFAIIQLGVANPSSAARLSRRAIEQLANVYQIANSDVFISGSIGVAIAETNESSIQELVRQADIALYRAKGAGRNQFCFFEKEMDSALQERSAIEKDLRIALENNELTVAFQPQVSADGLHIRGMEALVRWNHETRGVVPPSVFVPVAEETGLIRQLGAFVMRSSFSTARKWPDITMAVNVSAGELHHQDYASSVIALAREMGVQTDQIELEITETVLLENSNRVTRTIKALKAAGFRIALDDFGTGYSSLSYLRRHQVDKLKIDQSFVSSIGVREDAGAVVQAIIHLGEALGLSVTAEGVETETQRAALKARGCAYLQGYLFSRPIREDQIPDLIRMFDQRGKKRGAA